ncbi:unnamed protein product [Arabis nemorensis]|uniref:F-box domain-containing protein n=1 Tax=Arabis nemorensis TaxID=586526 RepID=A0A565BY25_9BRAS|nr:unnamed protein product [Arabis nemorensis]
MAFDGIKTTNWFMNVDATKVENGEQLVAADKKETAIDSVLVDEHGKNEIAIDSNDRELEQALETKVAEKKTKKRKLKIATTSSSRELCEKVEVEVAMTQYFAVLPRDKLDDTLEDLFGFTSDFNIPLNQVKLNNLVSLSFGSKNIRCWKLLPYLLNQSTKLETLIIKEKDGYTTDVYTPLHQVKVLHILGYQGTAQELKRLKSFLRGRNCVELVRVEIAQVVVVDDGKILQTLGVSVSSKCKTEVAFSQHNPIFPHNVQICRGTFKEEEIGYVCMDTKKLDTGSRDAISRLPDEILGDILSFVPIKLAASTSLLSKR